MRKRSAYKHEPFESKTEQGKFTKVCDDMMRSPAWNNLLLRQQGLYLHIKSKYTQKRSSGYIISDNVKDISLPKKEAATLYGDMRTFRLDMNKLMENGFIVLIQSGWNTRTANIYGFSDGWKRIQSSKSTNRNNSPNKKIAV